MDRLGMRRCSPNPTIRILLLGAEGVGKNCLESRFTTKLYPPPYNPALTLHSRRLFSLSCAAEGEKAGKAQKESASASFASTSLSGRTLISTDNTTDTADACSKCVRDNRKKAAKNNTFFVEVASAPVRQQALRRAADYNAVLLVYDVCERGSFASVEALHAEIATTRAQRSSRNKTNRCSVARCVRSWFSGGKKTGSSAVVVGLVGNKSDVDAEVEVGADADIVGNVDNIDMMDNMDKMDKMDKMDDVAPEEPAIKRQPSDKATDIRKSLLNPLYHESIMYEELMAGLARKEEKAEAEAAAQHSVPAPEPVVAQTLQQVDEAASKADIQKWLQISRLEPDHGDEVDTDIQGNPRTTLREQHRRQVSFAEGQALAESLQLAVPFLEISAKSGAQVELVFESVVREVLRAMGRDTSGTCKASKNRTCRHKAKRLRFFGCKSKLLEQSQRNQT